MTFESLWFGESTIKTNKNIQLHTNDIVEAHTGDIFQKVSHFLLHVRRNGGVLNCFMVTLEIIIIFFK